MKRLIALGSAAVIALTGLAPRAHAAVVDTFSFSNFGHWSFADSGLFGQFTGTVEPNGFIELADLSAFSVQGFILGSPLVDAVKANLAFFSYDTKGGASSLGFIAPDGNTAACSGAPSVLDLRCNPGGNNVASTRADILDDGFVVAYTADQTAVTLVSSVSTPEPSTWAMMLTGFAGLGLVGAARGRKGWAALQPAARPRDLPE